MKKLFVFLFGLLMFSFVACNKDKKLAVTVNKVVTADWGTADVEVGYTMKRNLYIYSVGVCWSQEENPDTSDNYLSDLESNTTNRNYHLIGLVNGETYYVRGFILKKDGSLLFSENYSFQAKEAPIGPCELEENKLTISSDSGSEYNFSFESPVTGTYMDDDDTIWYASCPFDDGTYSRIRFEFLGEPATGIYQCDDGLTYSWKQNPVQMSAQIEFAASIGWCDYDVSGVSFAPDKEVYVDNSGNGKIKISFCTTTMYTTQFCLEDYYDIKGSVVIE